jgi:hypothetical protein
MRQHTTRQSPTPAGATTTAARTCRWGRCSTGGKPTTSSPRRSSVRSPAIRCTCTADWARRHTSRRQRCRPRRWLCTTSCIVQTHPASIHLNRQHALVKAAHARCPHTMPTETAEDSPRGRMQRRPTSSHMPARAAEEGMGSRPPRDRCASGRLPSPAGSGHSGRKPSCGERTAGEVSEGLKQHTLYGVEACEGLLPTQ